MAAEKPGPEDTGFQPGLFTNVSFVTLAISAVLYLFGWFYLYGYFTNFGLSLSEVDLDPREVVIFGLTSALLPWGHVVLGFFVLVGLVLNEWLPGRRGKRHLHSTLRSDEGRVTRPFRFAAGTCGILIVLGTSFYAECRGRREAELRKVEPGCELPPVHLFGQKDKLPSDVAKGTADAGVKSVEGRLLAHAKKGYYVFTPVHPGDIPDSLKGTTKGMEIFFVPDEMVLAAIVEPCVGVK